jgi:hypothetical protein
MTDVFSQRHATPVQLGTSTRVEKLPKAAKRLGLSLRSLGFRERGGLRGDRIFVIGRKMVPKAAIARPRNKKPDRREAGPVDSCERV